MPVFVQSLTHQEKQRLKRRGELFHSWRIMHGKSRDYLARECNVSSKTIYNLEKGARTGSGLLYNLSIIGVPDDVLFPK